MQISSKSIEILQGFYNGLNENTTSLRVSFNPIETAKQKEISHQNLHMCLGYLVSKGYILEYVSYNSRADESTVESVVLTAKAIDLIERVV